MFLDILVTNKTYNLTSILLNNNKSTFENWNFYTKCLFSKFKKTNFTFLNKM